MWGWTLGLLGLPALTPNRGRCGAQLLLDPSMGFLDALCNVVSGVEVNKISAPLCRLLIIWGVDMDVIELLVKKETKEMGSDGTSALRSVVG